MNLPALKKLLFIAVLIPLLWVSCKKESKTPNPPANPNSTTPTTVKPTYALVWSDEFNGSTLDTSKWLFETGGGGWGNNELQYYQSNNTTVANGNLVITIKKESVGGEAYTSSRITTIGHFDQTYGRIEARMKLPMVAGAWPAFWALGANINTVSWPQCGEMDIMEHVNATDTVYGTMHWNNNGNAQYGSSTVTTPADYHLYAIEWDANQIRWYVDSTLYQTGNIKDNVNNTAAFHMPFFILFNLAAGGTFPNQAVNESLLPASMYVDYVRVYKQTN